LTTAPSNGHSRRATKGAGQPAPPSPLRRRATFVNRTTLHVEHLLNYRYPAEAHRIATRLVLTPPDIHGPQVLRSHELHVAPLPHAQPTHRDEFGNAVVEFRHEAAKRNLSFAVEMCLDTACHYDDDGRPLAMPVLVGQGAPPARFCDPTPLTAPIDEFRAVADDVRRALPPGADDPFDLTFALSRHVYRAMRYTPGATSVRTAAAEAWAGRHGVCQDFAHVLITLLRLGGVPARYVSGFLPGEGAMHAWVEALLPARPDAPADGGPDAWYGIDPTHDRWVNERYAVVAVGRDYADVTPTSGTFFGRAPGVLTHHSRVKVDAPVVTPL
jgi:transglutaminase-like putative cysteine protease